MNADKHCVLSAFIGGPKHLLYVWATDNFGRALAIRHIMASMIRRILVAALAGAILLLAADPSGTWTGDQPGPNGNTYAITFKLKADGGKRTRTMGGEQMQQRMHQGA